ncbi:hypothetical protein MTBBW1_980019 [Desulfamplus magnetovallimortis]|uniref:Uncharacterized protein n=1 Tax=Desulfamplus magnetovallimortis TaxID=1246637 RepID=A0A1W1HLC5_9BACT|nr:hypothetical protein MTBBW1_980019 [Desulfamplus magnetovallimortis]
MLFMLIRCCGSIISLISCLVRDFGSLPLVMILPVRDARYPEAFEPASSWELPELFCRLSVASEKNRSSQKSAVCLMVEPIMAAAFDKDEIDEDRIGIKECIAKAIDVTKRNITRSRDAFLNTRLLLLFSRDCF